MSLAWWMEAFKKKKEELIFFFSSFEWIKYQVPRRNGNGNILFFFHDTPNNSTDIGWLDFERDEKKKWRLQKDREKSIKLRGNKWHFNFDKSIKKSIKFSTSKEDYLFVELWHKNTEKNNKIPQNLFSALLESHESHSKNKKRKKSFSSDKQMRLVDNFLWI